MNKNERISSVVEVLSDNATGCLVSLLYAIESMVESDVTYSITELCVIGRQILNLKEIKEDESNEKVRSLESKNAQLACVGRDFNMARESNERTIDLLKERIATGDFMIEELKKRIAGKNDVHDAETTIPERTDITQSESNE